MINYIAPLPKFLINRYKTWKESIFEENKSWYAKIASEDQNPIAMVISCCDSRVHVTSIFGADEGEFFIHRNIANLIPPYKADGDYHGTSAAIEYATIQLNVPHILVLGHSSCGGINSGYHVCANLNKNNDFIFVNKWLSILKPAFNNLPKFESKEKQIRLLEEESIKVSIKNLSDFPNIKNSLKNNSIKIHGLWHDIGSGMLKVLNTTTGKFEKI